MQIRPETKDDILAISDVHREAFHGQKPPDGRVLEVDLVVDLRQSAAWIPRLSLVAEVDQELIGHCVCTRAHVGDVPVLALGPIGVTVDQQGQGVGKALMHRTIDVATEMGEPLIGLLGDYRYYERFGFVNASDRDIHPPDPDWGRSFQVLELSAYDPAIRGAFEYAAPFGSVS